MKNKLKFVALFAANLFLIGACNAGCADITTHVGGRDRVVAITSNSGGPDTIGHVNGNGDVTHPCGTQVGSGQNQQ